MTRVNLRVSSGFPLPLFSSLFLLFPRRLCPLSTVFPMPLSVAREKERELGSHRERNALDTRDYPPPTFSGEIKVSRYGYRSLRIDRQRERKRRSAGDPRQRRPDAPREFLSSLLTESRERGMFQLHASENGAIVSAFSLSRRRSVSSPESSPESRGVSVRVPYARHDFRGKLRAMARCLTTRSASQFVQLF